MRQSLNINLGQKLKLTPQLQNAIRLLQLSSVELSVEIQAALETNPFLEPVEEQHQYEANTEHEDKVSQDESLPPLNLQDHQAENSNFSENDNSFTDNHGDESNIREQTQDYSSSQSISDSQDYSGFLDNISHSDSLSDSLRYQARNSRVPPEVRDLCEVLIDNLDERGYLEITENELNDQLETTEKYEQRNIDNAISLLHSLDPPGIGARDLRECLLIQLRIKSNSGIEYQHALRIIQDNFDLLPKQDISLLSKHTDLTHTEISKALQVIRDLNPRPASVVHNSPAQYIIPDLVVSRIKDKWEVRLNSQSGDRIELSSASNTYLNATASQEDTLYFRERYQEAKWLLQSLEQRRKTILRVGEEIVKQQEGFFENGEAAMQPLTLKQIAVALDLHESTISRTTTQKYISSPHGIHELKYFFSSALESTEGNSHSSTSIQSKIKKLISNEPTGKPISDQKLADHFKNEGITVARRTIAKYREQLNIPPSSQRKIFFKP